MSKIWLEMTSYHQAKTGSSATIKAFAIWLRRHQETHCVNVPVSKRRARVPCGLCSLTSSRNSDLTIHVSAINRGEKQSSRRGLGTRGRQGEGRRLQRKLQRRLQRISWGAWWRRERSWRKRRGRRGRTGDETVSQCFPCPRYWYVSRYFLSNWQFLKK